LHEDRLLSAKAFERQAFEAANQLAGHDLVWFEERLHAGTAPLAAGAHAVCVFVNDRVDADTVAQLAGTGARLILCRSAGYNHVDLAAAGGTGSAVMRVPAYSPESVAEHACRHGAVAGAQPAPPVQPGAQRQLLDGQHRRLDAAGKTAGIVGTGHIGLAMARILNGFGCTLLGSRSLSQPGMRGAGHAVCAARRPVRPVRHRHARKRR
jgi:D-lactate dehydrogenase